MKLIYTVGTSTRSKEEFIDIIDFYGIKKVIDVRRFPKSRYIHFNRENLKQILQSEGILYVYLGHELGGFRKDGYEKFMENKRFTEGIYKLEKEALEVLSTVVCAERFAWRCHRRFIGWALSKRGWEVIHIVEKERLWRDKRGCENLFG